MLMAAQRKSNKDLAILLGKSERVASRKKNGEEPFRSPMWRTRGSVPQYLPASS